MTIMQKIRIYHASLAILALLSYVTGEFGLIHSWLGYGVTAVIIFRLLWTLNGNPHIGLTRFYPSFEGLNLTNVHSHPSISKALVLGIALCLLLVSATAIAIDKGKDIGLANVQLTTTAFADDDDEDKSAEDGGESLYEEALEETHEFLGNFLLLFVGAHAGYLLLFRRPLANFMLFMNKEKK